MGRFNAFKAFPMWRIKAYLCQRGRGDYLSVNAPVKALGSFLNVALSSLGRDKLLF